MLNDNYLTAYCGTFFGYGNWEAPLWFIGIEEAGGYSEKAADTHIRTWHGRNRPILESLPDFCQASGITQWYGENAQPQPTWEQLIRLLLVAQGNLDSPAAILDYQRTRLGTATGEMCLLELFPLPSPSVNICNYWQWSQLSWLQTREAYELHIAANRIKMLRQKIELCKPRIVVFYGAGQLKHWQKIMGPGTYARPIPDKLIAHERGPTAFYVITHPTAPQLGLGRNEYFKEIGRFIYDHHPELRL